MPPDKKGPSKEVSKFRRYASDIVEHYLGIRPTRVAMKAGGLTNHVFLATVKSSKYIVRISPKQSHLDTFIKEQWVEGEISKLGVPTPEILETGSSVVPHPYSISEFVKGRPAADHPDRPRVLRELGELAEKINSVKTDAFGCTFDWSLNELSRHETFGDYLRNEFLYEGRIEVLRKHDIGSEELCDRLRAVGRELERTKATPHLNHGDLRLKNVLVDDEGRIKSLLDWEKAISNLAPQWELSIALHDLSIDEMNCFLDGYGSSDKNFVAMSDQIKFFNILNYTKKVELAAAAGDRAELARIRLRLTGALDLYSL